MNKECWRTSKIGKSTGRNSKRSGSATEGLVLWWSRQLFSRLRRGRLRFVKKLIIMKWGRISNHSRVHRWEYSRGSILGIRILSGRVMGQGYLRSRNLEVSILTTSETRSAPSQLSTAKLCKWLITSYEAAFQEKQESLAQPMSTGHLKAQIKEKNIQSWHPQERTSTRQRRLSWWETAMTTPNYPKCRYMTK